MQAPSTARDDDFRQRYGPCAVVAGASLGLGLAWSHALARRGLDVVMIAESDAPLNEVAADVARQHGVSTTPLVVDLAQSDAAETIAAATLGLDVGIVVYNAAVSPIGRFIATPTAALRATIDVNCHGPTQLCAAFAPRLVGRGRGALVLMSSLSAMQGQAMVGTYAATKAFNLVFAESLWNELADEGVDVLAVCPGATRTPGFEASRPRLRGLLAPPVMPPEPVIEEALAALGRQPVLIPGRSNRLAAWAFRHLVPRRAAVRLMSRATRAMYER